MPSASISNTTPFTTYSMTVQARNAIGYGPESPPIQSQFNYNKASGGVEQEFAEGTYNGEPGTWKTHTFESSGTLDVILNVYPFHVLVVGAGGAGGTCNTSVHGPVNAPGGGAGRVVDIPEMEIPLGNKPVVVGDPATNDKDSVFNGQIAPGGGLGGAAGGGGGGVGGSGGGGGGSHGNGGPGGAANPGSPVEGLGTAGGNAGYQGMQHAHGGGALSVGPNGGVTLNISGSDEIYGKGGQVSASGGNPGGYGAGGNGQHNARGVGGKGVVIIAYRTG